MPSAQEKKKMRSPLKGKECAVTGKIKEWAIYESEHNECHVKPPTPQKKSRIWAHVQVRHIYNKWNRRYTIWIRWETKQILCIIKTPSIPWNRKGKEKGSYRVSVLTIPYNSMQCGPEYKTKAEASVTQ